MVSLVSVLSFNHLVVVQIPELYVTITCTIKLTTSSFEMIRGIMISSLFSRLHIKIETHKTKKTN